MNKHIVETLKYYKKYKRGLKKLNINFKTLGLIVDRGVLIRCHIRENGKDSAKTVSAEDYLNEICCAELSELRFSYTPLGIIPTTIKDYEGYNFKVFDFYQFF